MRLVGAKVSGSVNLADLVGAGIVKYFEERALSGVIGNGTFMSGAIKLAIAYVARRFMGKGFLGDAVGLGFGVDGIEDILTNFLGGTVGAGAQNW